MVYLGTLNYLLDTGSNTLETVEGTEVERDELTNSFDEVRDMANAPVGLIEMIEDRDDGIMPMMNGAGEEIDSPTTYAKTVYGGTWTCHEQYKNALTDSTVNDSADNTCVPIAITNAIKMYGNKYANREVKAQEVKRTDEN